MRGASASFGRWFSSVPLQAAMALPRSAVPVHPPHCPLRVCEVGIRALAAMPLPTEKRIQGQADVPVVVQGVIVRPGEWLYADEDGIVVMTGPA